MTDIKQINAFANKWLLKFNDENINYLELVENDFGDECFALKFEMGCGHSFAEKYGRAFDNVEELKKVIENINDINLLGSAIFSKWRYFNHWAYSGEEILKEENREWFILSLNRLAFYQNSLIVQIVEFFKQ